MKMLEKIRHLWKHVVWADHEILEAVRSEDASSEAFREFSHVIGCEEVWLSRLEARPPRAPVWPSVTRAELERLVDQTHDGYGRYLEELSEMDLERSVRYTNSAGTSFATPVGDILLHVVLHGQYHRGKVNLLLRQSGRDPAPTDYIAFVRGAPAATRADAGASRGNGSRGNGSRGNGES